MQSMRSGGGFPPAYAQPLAQLQGQGVGVGLWGQGGVEGGVKHSHLRSARSVAQKAVSAAADGPAVQLDPSLHSTSPHLRPAGSKPQNRPPSTVQRYQPASQPSVRRRPPALEPTYMRHVWEGGHAGVDAVQVGGVVQRRQGTGLLNLLPHLLTALGAQRGTDGASGCREACARCFRVGGAANRNEKVKSGQAQWQPAAHLMRAGAVRCSPPCTTRCATLCTSCSGRGCEYGPSPSNKGTDSTSRWAFQRPVVHALCEYSSTLRQGITCKALEPH